MKRPLKFGNKPTLVDGIRFASKREAARYSELKLMERAGEISDLVLQPRYPLLVNGLKVATYVADFRYRDLGLDAVVVEDAKGFRTPDFILKSKLFEALHGFPVREV